MNNYLLSIGCDSYESKEINDLQGAENDASNIYNTLLEEESTIYDITQSKYLKSPTLVEFRDALEQMLYDSETPDIFTLFFAGHGGIVDGTYYLVLKNSKLDRLSISAISLSEILNILSSSGVKHINLIMDSCQTAGLVNDLLSVIKPEILGKKGSISIAILAAAASDEYATEENGEGIFTSSLIKYINGSKKITTDLEYLDLSLLGKKISDEFLEEGKTQTPSSWSLNIYGFSLFSKNLYFDGSDSIGLHDFSYLPRISILGEVLEPYKKDLWKHYERLEETSNLSELLYLLQNIFDNIDDENKAVFIKGVAYRFIDKIDSNLTMKKLELINVFKSLLLPYLENELFQQEMKNLISLYIIFAKKSIEEIIGCLEQDKYYLIDKENIHANYYYLPIRISKIFALISQLLLIDLSSKDIILKLIDMIKSNYRNHLKIINDCQGAYLNTFFKIFSKLNLQNEVKDIFEYYINDFISISGHVANIYIDNNETFKYIEQRYFIKRIEYRLLAIPLQVGSVLILNSRDYTLNDLIDLNMHCFDKKSFLFFIPSDIKDFSLKLIENGNNKILQCGLDFWTVDDFEKIYSKSIINYDFDSEFIDLCCISSSYIQPNRIAIT